MFQFSPAPEVLWPVTIETPAEGGTTIRHRIQVRYRMIDRGAVDTLMETLPPQANQAELLRDVVTGWADVRDQDGQEVPFSAEALDEALAWPFVARCLFRGFFAAQAGAPEKN